MIIAHEMSAVHSSMGEYPRAISPSVILHPTYSVADDSDADSITFADSESIADDSDADPITSSTVEQASLGPTTLGY